MEQKIYKLPQELAADANFICHILNKASKYNSSKIDCTAKVINYSSQSFDIGNIGDVFIQISIGSVSWISSKWIDEYIWPLIKKHTDKPSEEIIVWLKKILLKKEK